MANYMQWYQTQMPPELIDVVTKDLSKHDTNFETARTTGGVTLHTRDSKTIWIQENHWIVGLCWHYVMVANKNNFLYDVTEFESGTLQYTSYQPGEYYHWHVDGDIANYRLPEDGGHEEKVRKLSIIVQLSDPSEYTGGEVQLQFTDKKTAFLPKTAGSITVFDSRCLHRVKPVLTGHRKSLVGWASGPRWK